MKKLLSLVLALMMVLCLTPAVAEGVESYYDGVWVQFEDGFEIYVTADWLQLEQSESELASGIFFSACSPDAAKLMQVGWAALGTEMTIEELHAALSTVFPYIELMEVNGIQLLCTADADSSTLMFIGLDGVQPGYYSFLFYPMEDEELLAYAAVIASSLRNI